MVMNEELKDVKPNHNLVEEWIGKPSIREMLRIGSFSTKVLLNLSIKLGIISREELYLVKTVVKRVQLLRI